MAYYNCIQAARLKNFLLQIYHSKKNFELLVINKRPKTRMGVYIVPKRRILIYYRWAPFPLEEIAIHEYAHHIHETEIRRSCRERAHGSEFQRIYTALCYKATATGLFPFLPREVLIKYYQHLL